MRKFLTSKWTIALLLSIPILLSLPNVVFKKYQLKLDKVVNSEFSNTINNYSVDMDGDGSFEKIVAVSPMQQLSIVYYDEDNNLLGQYNFPGNVVPGQSKLHFMDVDRDGIIEVYGFTVMSDSLFLNAYEILSEDSDASASIFISKVSNYDNGKYDVQIPQFHCVDLDQDGSNELVFVLHNGFSLSPRQLIVVHPEEGKVQYSPNRGMAITRLNFADLTGDGKLEILCGTRATDNIGDKIPLPYKDKSTWFVAFDADLKDLFPPLKIQDGLGSRTRVMVVDESRESEKTIYVLATSVASENPAVTFFEVNISGQVTDTFNTEIDERFYYNYLFQETQNSWLVQLERDKMHRISFHPFVMKEIPFRDGNDQFCNASFDLDHNGKIEHLSFSPLMKSYFVYSDNFKHVNAVVVENANRSHPLKKGENGMFIDHFEGFSEISYRRNPLYELKYGLWLLIYLAVVLIVFIIQKLNEMQVKEKYELQNKVRDLQLSTFRNQLHPHFIYNTFNSIMAAVMREKKEEAYDLFSSFMNLLRTNLNNTEAILVPLKDEIMLMKRFLEIQSYRFKNLFTYEIHVDEEIDQTLLFPKMMLQIHVENAIKHGLQPKKAGGELTIQIRQEAKQLHITIADNGIGRLKAKELNTHGTGLGQKTIHQFIKHINASKEMQVQQKIIDFHDEQGNACGTEVRVVVGY